MQKDKILKYLFSLAVLIIVFLFGISFRNIYDVQENVVTFQDNIAIKKASLMIDYGNGKVHVSEDIPVVNDMTVFGLLKSFTDNNNLVLNYKDYGGSMGIFVESIDGVGKDITGKKYWQYWVNNKYSPVGVSGLIIKEGDVVEFKFIQGQL